MSTKSFIPLDEQLTPSLKVDTGLPFPPSADLFDETNKLALETTSELIDHHSLLEYFKKSGKLRLLHDKKNRPIIALISDGEELTLLRYGVYDLEGWSVHDITPKGKKAATFDVFERRGKLYFALACQNESREFHDLYSCVVDTDSDAFNSAAPNDLEKALKWVEIKDNVDKPYGPHIISSLLCKVSSPSNSPTPLFEILVGTSAHGSVTGTHYIVSTPSEEGKHDSRWYALTFAAAGKHILQTVPLVLGRVESSEREDAIMTTFKDFKEGEYEYGRVNGQVCDVEGGYKRSFEFYAGKLEDVRSAFSHHNPWGLTDVFMAGRKGIGYFSYENISQLHSTLLPTVSFQQVIASEALDPECPTKQTKIAIFAVSDEQHLYFFEGTRTFANKKLEFIYSGLPIRAGITHMAAMYNAAHGTSELVYAATEENAILYLRREPDGKSYHEDRIVRKGRKAMTQQVFATTLTFSSSKGDQIPVGYKVEVTAAGNIQATANGVSLSLSEKPSIASTDDQGIIFLTVPAEGKLGCPKITLTVRHGEETFNHTFDPSVRVQRLIGKLKSPDAIEKAKDPNGKSVFSGLDRKQKGNMANLIGRYDKVQSRLDSDTSGSEVEDESDELSEWGQSDTPDESVGPVEKFFGDVIETIKSGIQKAIKFSVKYFGPVVKIFIEIAGKVFQAVVRTLFELAETFAGTLESIFGKNIFSELLRLLKLSFDPESIRKTQKVLTDTYSHITDLADRFLEVNEQSVNDILFDAKFVLSKFIDDPRPPTQNGAARDILAQFAWIFNNPIVRTLSKINPVVWVSEAVKDEIKDVEIPSLMPMAKEIGAIIGRSLEEIFDQIISLFSFVMENVSVAAGATGPSALFEALLRAAKGAFWTIFDCVRIGTETAYKAFRVLVKGLLDLFQAKWKIPGITDVWEVTTGSDFSLLGFVTYIPAVAMNLVSLMERKKLPFDGMSAEDFGIQNFSVEQFYTSKFRGLDPTILGSLLKPGSSQGGVGSLNIPIFNTLVADVKLPDGKEEVSITEDAGLLNTKLYAMNAESSACIADPPMTASSLEEVFKVLTVGNVHGDAEFKTSVSQSDAILEERLMDAKVSQVREEFGFEGPPAKKISKKAKVSNLDIPLQPPPPQKKLKEPAEEKPSTPVPTPAAPSKSKAHIILLIFENAFRLGSSLASVVGSVQTGRERDFRKKYEAALHSGEFIPTNVIFGSIQEMDRLDDSARTALYAQTALQTLVGLSQILAVTACRPSLDRGVSAGGIAVTVSSFVTLLTSLFYVAGDPEEVTEGRGYQGLHGHAYLPETPGQRKLRCIPDVAVNISTLIRVFAVEPSIGAAEGCEVAASITGTVGTIAEKYHNPKALAAAVIGRGAEAGTSLAAVVLHVKELWD